MSAAATEPTVRGFRQLDPQSVGEARFLWVVGIAYVLWTLVPIGIAVLFSFNATPLAHLVAGLLLAVVRGRRQLGVARPGAARRRWCRA